MNRRGFLQLIAASVAVATLPIPKTAFAQFIGERVSLFACPPLSPGLHTVNALCGRGLFVAGIQALGGETQIAIPEDVYQDVYLGTVTIELGANNQLGDYHRGELLHQGERVNAIRINGGTVLFNKP